MLFRSTMWAYLARRYCGSSQAQLYTLNQTLGGLQQGDDTIDQFYSRYYKTWRQINTLSPPECPTHTVALNVACAPCALRSRHEETRRLYEFLIQLCPEFESSRAQLPSLLLPIHLARHSRSSLLRRHASGLPPLVRALLLLPSDLLLLLC